MGNIMLILRGRYQLFPERIIAEILPVLVASGHIVEAGHVHEIGHVSAGEYGGIEDGMEVQSGEQRNFPALVEHLHFIGK